MQHIRPPASLDLAAGAAARQMQACQQRRRHMSLWLIGRCASAHGTQTTALQHAGNDSCHGASHLSSPLHLHSVPVQAQDVTNTQHTQQAEMLTPSLIQLHSSSATQQQVRAVEVRRYVARRPLLEAVVCLLAALVCRFLLRSQH
jgi:hypothetical protein